MRKPNTYYVLAKLNLEEMKDNLEKGEGTQRGGS